MKRRLIATFCSMALMIATIGCGQNVEPASNAASVAEGESDGATEGGRKFGFTSIDSTNPLFKAVEDSIKENLEPGDVLLESSPRCDVALQISQIEDMIAQGIDGMFLCPVDAQGIQPALDQLAEAGIPVINFDSEIADPSFAECFVGSDNYQAGYICGEDLVKKCPEGGSILVLDYPTVQSMVDRVNGFLDAIEGHGFEVVGQLDCKGSLDVAMTNTEDLLQAHPDIVAIFGGNDPSAIGAQAACKAAGLTDVKIYGVDGSPDIKAELANSDSLIEGCGAQSPKTMGAKAAELMLKALDGEKLDDKYSIDTILITRDNVDEYGVDGWQ